MEAGASSSLGVETAVSSSLGAMGPLLRKLDLLMEPTYWLPKRVKEGIELLKEDLEEVSSALLELLTVATTSLRAKCWMEEARDLSYDVEDFVDGMIRTRTKSGMIRTRTIADARMRSARGPRVRRVKIAGLPALPKRSTRISRIETFRTLLREATERYERYQLDYCCSSSSLVTTGYNQTPALYGDAANLVGINDSKIKLKDMLTIEGDQQLKVVSIVGPAGIGKTTLANEMYHELGKQFDFRAFVRVSRKPDMRRLLGAILSQVRQNQQPPFNAFSVQHLIDIIKEHFRDKRYFIVIDDLWDRTAWDILCAAFPHGDNSSRIIVTTENANVSLGCGSYRHSNILKMKPLNIRDSSKLFFSRGFSFEQCHDEIKELSHGIIRDCGGIPLAIINLAGALASQIDCSELWYHVKDNLCSTVNRTCTVDEMLKEILNLCYNRLPRCLKTCLLYFTMYPEGYIIQKVDLVKHWIAEGFIDATEGKQNVETADSYFDELVNRGMIQPVAIDYNDVVLSCTVHHIVLDFITQMCKEEKFISAIDCSQTVTGISTKFHRLSFHFSSARYGKQPAGITMSNSRSLAFFGLVKLMPSIMKFNLLRVLILEIWGNHHDHTSLNISRICRLLQLRYLKVSSDIVVELPAQMRELLYLETIEIDARICDVPLDIVCLPRLMHLCLRGATNLPDGIGRIKSLYTLQYFDLSSNSEHNLRSLGELTNLRHLHLTCSATLSDEDMKRKLILLVSSLRKFSNLESLILTPDVSGRALLFYTSSSISSPSVFVQRLELLPPICFFSRLPSWLGQLHGLRILNIVIKDLASDDINMLTGLPALTILVLYVRTALKRTIIFTDMAFSALRYLKLSCSVMLLSFQEGAMPDLRKLKLCFNADRENNYGQLVDGIEHLLNLHEVAGRIGEAQGADKLDRKAVESLFEDAIKKHPRNPSINIRWIDLMDEDPPLWKQHGDILHGSNTEDMNIRSASRSVWVPIRVSELMHPPSASRYSDDASKYDMLVRILEDESAEPASLDLSLLGDLTNWFSSEQEIGRGVFGVVYKGELGDRIVAVKRLRLYRCQAILDEEFQNILECLLEVKHINVVRFLGYCIEKELNVEKEGLTSLYSEETEMLLCFEYLHNGSLQRHITDESCGLEWHTRYQIIKGICHGLDYLHEKCIFHLDLKPENILLNVNMVPKIADYGFARLLSGHRRTLNQDSLLDCVAPEYYETGDVTVKLDIYSLGALIMLIVTGQKDHPNIGSVVRGWRNRLELNTLPGHTALETSYDQVKVCVEMGIKCMHHDPGRRPVLRDIILMFGQTGVTGQSVRSGMSVVSKFNDHRMQFTPKIPSGAEAQLVSPPRSGKDITYHHQQTNVSGRKEISTSIVG
ncbi:hypothetical protein EJB05_03239, partial [Eragrostis curvula]